MTPGKWSPYVLLPSANGRPEPLLVTLDNFSEWYDGGDPVIVESWPLTNVIKNFVWSAVYHHLAQPKDDKHTIREDMKRWIATTQDLANRLPYGGTIRELMLAAAAGLDEHMVWKAKYFHEPPSEIGTKRDADHTCSMNLWAIDQIVRGLNAVDSSLHVSPTKIWDKLFREYSALPVPPAFSEYKQAQRRIKHLQEGIKPDMALDLMSDLLRQVLTNGHFGRDGQPRNRSTTN